jgi:hypothetical protein
MQGVLERGAELVAVGSADPGTCHDAGYGFYSLWKLPDREVVQVFEQGIEDDGWYEYFEQVNASGEIMEFDALPSASFSCDPRPNPRPRAGAAGPR